MAAVSNGLKNFAGNATGPQQAEIIVRAEEALIVGLVLGLWVAAIALFFNRWGKIRMLEPYQPKFTQQHRASCPLVDQTIIQHRSFSKFNVAGDPLFGHSKIVRPRQNSVFVGSSLVTFPPNLPRKVKSAFDLQHLVVSEPTLHKGNPAAPAAVKITLDGPPFRRQSLLSVSPKKIAADFYGGDGPIGCSKERRLSFKDLVDLEKSLRCDKVHCRGEKEVQKGELSARQLKPNFPNQGSINESGRRNSIAFLDLKPFSGNSGRLGAPERRHSLLPGQKCTFLHTREAEGTRLDAKIGVTDFRRNSALLSCSFENDRSFLSPRETVKSGVVDFRRNSMLIINNLTEDMGCKLFTRNFSLGGSNMGLASESYAAFRRDSGNIFSCHEAKQKTSHAKTKQNFPSKLNVFNSTDGKYGGGHSSKSFDFGDSADRKLADRRNKKEIGRCSFAGEGRPAFPGPSFVGSSTSLNTCLTQRDLGRVDGARSTDDVNSDAAKGSRTDSDTQNETFDVHRFDLEEAPERLSVPKVNITSSLTNLTPTSGE